MYMIVAIAGLAIIIARRYMAYFGKAELGGPTRSKYLSSGALFVLYFLFLAIISLDAYGVISNPFSI
jgi:solute carrier family 8 (sodium/calcium exchanger)